jgi:hypothetical protein
LQGRVAELHGAIEEAERSASSREEAKQKALHAAVTRFEAAQAQVTL